MNKMDGASIKIVDHKCTKSMMEEDAPWRTD